MGNQTNFKQLKYQIIMGFLFLFLSKPCQVYADTEPIAFGVDVSKYQGHIDWNQVKQNSDVDFAILKCGSFKSGIDSEFYSNVRGCVANDIPFGIYIYSYATTVDEAIDEAFYVKDLIEGLPVAYPICYDIEDVCQLHLTSEEKQNLINAFCATVQNLGYHPMIYSSKNWLEKKIVTIDWDVWVAQFNTACSYSGDYDIWQNSSHAFVNGIPKRVDTNYQYHTFDDRIRENGFYKSGDHVFCRKDYVIQRGLFEYDGEIYYANDHGHMQTGDIQRGEFRLTFDNEHYQLKCVTNSYKKY